MLWRRRRREREHNPFGEGTDPGPAPAPAPVASSEDLPSVKLNGVPVESPPPPISTSSAERLRKLERLRDSGALTAAEFETARRKLL